MSFYWRLTEGTRLFVECESAMYRSKRELQPKIPSSAIISDMLPNTIYEAFYRCAISVNYRTAIMLVSDNILEFLSQIPNIQFDRTF